MVEMLQRPYSALLCAVHTKTHCRVRSTDVMTIHLPKHLSHQLVQHYDCIVIMNGANLLSVCVCPTNTTKLCVCPDIPQFLGETLLFLT